MYIHNQWLNFQQIEFVAKRESGEKRSQSFSSQFISLGEEAKIFFARKKWTNFWAKSVPKMHEQRSVVDFQLSSPVLYQDSVWNFDSVARLCYGWTFRREEEVQTAFLADTSFSLAT